MSYKSPLFDPIISLSGIYPKEIRAVYNKISALNTYTIFKSFKDLHKHLKRVLTFYTCIHALIILHNL